MKKEKQAVILPILTVTYDINKGSYKVTLGKGSNAAETAFAMAVTIKCLKRDGFIEDTPMFLKQVETYCNDPQWDEVKKDV